MSDEKQERLDWAIQTCVDRGLRRTNAMRELLKELIASKSPKTLADLVESKRLHGQSHCF